ncbi:MULTISPECIES: AzlD family protein [Providencia]|uniref:AzlD family protein n=1 Tax=Providencia TaxID=586 RepID=UPI001F1479C2|nr:MULTISPECIES: AzlD family protein [Providencia]
MSLQVLFTILLMAFSTFAIRCAGYIILRNRNLSPKIQQIIEAVPGCVLLTVITPYFATSSPVNLLALVISIVATSRFSLLPVVIISVVSTAVLRGLF